MSITIEPAAPSDGPAILDLLAASGLPGENLLEHLGTAFVARADDRVVGSAALEVYAESALLRSVAVDPSVRGAGVGQGLTRAALDLARRLRVEKVYLLTTTAEQFFPRLGFSRMARAEVPAAVQESVEFRLNCCASAVAMCCPVPDRAAVPQ